MLRSVSSLVLRRRIYASGSIAGARGGAGLVAASGPSTRMAVFAPVLLSGGGLEFDDELGGHPATVFYVDALGFSPLANFGGVQAGRRSPASVPG